MSQRLVLASSNAGKLREFNSLLADFGFEVVPQADLGVNDAEETGLSFVENALIKARHASQVTGLAALADDSGLVVDALGGQPGIYSARFAGQPTHCAKVDELHAPAHPTCLCARAAGVRFLALVFQFAGAGPVLDEKRVCAVAAR